MGRNRGVSVITMTTAKIGSAIANPMYTPVGIAGWFLRSRLKRSLNTYAILQN